MHEERALREQHKEPFQSLQEEGTEQETFKAADLNAHHKKHFAAPYKNRKFSFASCVEFPIFVRNINPSLMWKQGQARSFKDRDQRNSRLKDSS